MTPRRRNQRWEELDKANMPLSRLIRHYETFNQTEGKSPKTISWYTDNLLTFETFLERSGRSTLLGDVGIDEVREFILYLQQKQRWDGNHGGHIKDDRLSPFTVQGFVRSLKAFYSWLYQEGYTEDNELAYLKLPEDTSEAGANTQRRRDKANPILLQSLNDHWCEGHGYHHDVSRYRH